jgi:MFS family permease
MAEISIEETTVEVQAAEASPSEAPGTLSAAERRRMALYFAGLIVLIGFPENLLPTPISFFLKNKLHLAAHQIAVFSAIATIPAYGAVAFGFVRDKVSPLGLGDRGYFILAGAGGAVICLAFAFVAPSYGVFLTAALTLTVVQLFVSSASRGLIGAVSQRNALTGQAASLMSTVGTAPVVAAMVLGGLFSDLLERHAAAESSRILFLVGAAMLTAVALYGLLKPRSVFDHARRERLAGEHPLADLRRLARHAPIYPALLIWLLWQFTPGLGTPLQFYLQNTLHFSDSQFGLWGALYFFGGTPGFVLYGILCRRFPLGGLLFWGTIAAIPMMFPLLFMPNASVALAGAAPMGLVGGLAGAAYFDLIIRSSPAGLQGTVLMAATMMLALDGQVGNLLGTALFDHFHNFTVCVIAMTVSDLLVLPALLLVPRQMTATADA